MVLGWTKVCLHELKENNINLIRYWRNSIKEKSEEDKRPFPLTGMFDVAAAEELSTWSIRFFHLQLNLNKCPLVLFDPPQFPAKRYLWYFNGSSRSHWCHPEQMEDVKLKNASLPLGKWTLCYKKTRLEGENIFPSVQQWDCVSDHRDSHWPKLYLWNYTLMLLQLHSTVGFWLNKSVK